MSRYNPPSGTLLAPSVPIRPGGDNRAPASEERTARAYWPFIAMSALSRADDFGKALQAPGGPNMTLPYANVVRMHIMIFIFAGLYGAGLAGYAVYPVLALYFFPAGSLVKLAIRKSRGRKQPA